MQCRHGLTLATQLETDQYNVQQHHTPTTHILYRKTRAIPRQNTKAFATKGPCQITIYIYMYSKLNILYIMAGLMINNVQNTI